jgi:hypothetical protein
MPRTLLVGTRRTGPVEPEAESVVIDTDDYLIVRLELDDGEEIELDRVELEAALRPVA